MKSIKVLTLFLLTALAIFYACGSDSRPGSSVPPAPESAPPKSPKPAIYLYQVTVDKLNLREQPNKKGNVITQFAEGSFVEGTGEISPNREAATLRGIPYNEPYFQVKSSDYQHLGWVYSAALEPVYAGSRATSPDMNRLSKLSTFLKSLDVTRLENGKKASDYVKTNLASASGTLADAAFILLENFLSRMEIEGNYYEQTERIQWTDSDYQAIWADKYDMNSRPLTKSLSENGFRLDVGEGVVFPVVDWSKLADFFAGRVTPPMKEYLLQTLAEQKQSAYDDGGIIIGLDTLAERAIFWEKFNKLNPYFVRNAETNESERWLRLVLLNGSDNTPVFDYDDQSVMADYKKVWVLIRQKYPGTKLANDVKTLSELCAAEGWKRSEKVAAWQTNYANEFQENE